MKLKIQGKFGQFDVRRFILAENDDLKIEVDASEAFSLAGDHFLTAKFHETKKQFKISKSKTEIVIPSSFFNGKVGSLEFSLIQRSSDGSQSFNEGVYTIEPILIERMADGTFYGTAQYQTIKAELEDLKKAYDRERFAREDAEKAFETLQMNIVKRDEERDKEIKRLVEMMEIIVQDRYHISLYELAKENGIKGV